MIHLRRQLPYRPTERMNVVSYPIRDIVMEAKREEAKGKKMIYLNIGDPPQYGFEPFRVIADQVKVALAENWKGYAPSEGDEEFRNTVAKIEKCKPEDVFAVAGLTEGIDFFFHSFIGFGEKVLLPNPVYPLYLSKAKQFEGDSVFYRHDADGQIDVANLSKKIEGAKAMVIINPNNPLGSLYSEKNLAEVVKLCSEYDVPIFYDGSYDRLILEGKPVDFRKIARGKVPFIYGSSLSKDFSYTGARIGWVAFHGERWAEVKNAFFLLCNQRLSVNWEYQKAAAVAMVHPSYPAYIADMNRKLIERRNTFIKMAGKLPLSFPVPKGAFYAFIRIESQKWRKDLQFVRAALKEGVVFVPGSGFGRQEDGVYFRSTFLPEPHIIEEAFSKIKRLL
ncbi:putative aspartate aminotransferase [Candidatus Sulfobium mesophilum]|uniref:alanine transaminase n=1 Tax=Candidatus Sulfobium mesophilum TaxID=2016548 RepID=A0A2U3QG81_9BACT|nr:putative aspartate aminotransferase [Candidatus Sulfobium mesophilum]